MLERLKKFKSLPVKDKIRIVTGIVLIIAGIAVILSVILVPYFNKKRNKAAVDAIKQNVNVTEEPQNTTGPALETTESAAETTESAATADPEEEARQRREALLADGNCIGVVIIDKIGVELAIQEGDDDEVLKHAVGHMTSSASIGQKGNCVLSAHHGGYYGEFFLNIDKLEKEDIIQIIDKSGNIHNYSVYDKKTVQRTDWSVVDELNEQSTLTLITCVDSSQEQRIIVSAIEF